MRASHFGGVGVALAVPGAAGPPARGRAGAALAALAGPAGAAGAGAVARGARAAVLARARAPALHAPRARLADLQALPGYKTIISKNFI